MSIHDKHLYLPSGFLNVQYLVEKLGVPFLFVTGGRGTGKTYGMLEYLIEESIKFVFMRRTQTEIDECLVSELSPMRSVNKAHSWGFEPFKITKNVSGFWDTEVCENGSLQRVGQLVGYIMALTTVANIRGFDASDADVIFYDEFIPEEHKKSIKGEAQALFNAYETIARNRELKGKKPAKLICMSNANTITNPIFIELGLINKIVTMQSAGEQVYIDRGRGLAVIMLDKSPIADLKKQTALYRLTKGTTFQSMAIENDFNFKSYVRIKSMPLVEYIPILQVGECYIYQHKSRNELYVSASKRGNFLEIGTSNTERIKLMRFFDWIWQAYLNNMIIFENIGLEVVFCDYYGKQH